LCCSLFLDKETGLIRCQTLFLNAVDAIWLPLSMNAVLRTIQEKKISNHPFLHHSLLNCVGESAVKNNSHMVESKFVSKLYIIEAYLVVAINTLKNVGRAKELWLVKCYQLPQAVAFSRGVKEKLCRALLAIQKEFVDLALLKVTCL
jgi:hypothetical protein